MDEEKPLLGTITNKAKDEKQTGYFAGSSNNIKY
jgi:hypothetical protein